MWILYIYWILGHVYLGLCVRLYMSHIMRKPVYAICEQQRRRSACTSTQSDHHLCCSLPGLYNTSTCYSQNFKTLASLISWAGWFESYLVTTPEDRFSRDVAHIIWDFIIILTILLLPIFILTLVIHECSVQQELIIPTCLIGYKKKLTLR